ncbi:MAG: acyclic terpene utilization AtuA family protein, partial [Myxococcota bacterium]
MADPIRIANCSGFFGDRLSAAREMVEGGPIDALTGDWLAELTMLILARTRLKRPDGGYARTFVTQMEQVMGTCLDRGIKVVSNAGGLDPEGCAAGVAEVAETLGLHPKIAFVRGDDLMPRIDGLLASDKLRHFESGDPIKEASFLTANAYLGCWGIVDALNRGADIVITGRATDAAIVCGPAAWHHGWSRSDWDALAGAVAAGHVIECGTQATGGNYSFFTEVQGMTRTGFPFAEVAADGSSVIGKHEGTGGEVSVGTVTSQLLYEIGGPEYFGPDVTTRFDTIQLEQQAPDRVRMHGIKGEPPPATLKVCINRAGGFRNSMTACLTGLDIEAKAKLIEEAFWVACPYAPEDYAQVTTNLVRTDQPDPASNEQAVALLRITVKDPDEKKTGRAFANAMTELGLATIPGFFGVGGGPAGGRPCGVYEPACIPSDLVTQEVVILDGDTRQVSSVIPPTDVDVEPAPEPKASAPGGPTQQQPLGSVYGARSGDKGGNANLGMFARSDEAWAWLDEFLSSERLRELLPEVAGLPIDRHRLPALRSLNFV